jgi:hypothetical protein
MSTCITFVFSQLDEGVRRREWDPWAAGNGLVLNTGNGCLYKGKVEVFYRSKRNITFSVPHLDEEMTELIRLALAFWVRFGGRPEASAEVRVLINQAFMVANPVSGPGMDANGIRVRP